jgi:hypothetical protein
MILDRSAVQGNRFEELRAVGAKVQNAIAVAAVAVAIMMLGLTLVAPRILVVTDAPASYADAS